MFQRIVLTSGVSLLFNNRDDIESKFPSFFKTPEPLTEATTALSDDVILFLTDHLASMTEEQLRWVSAEVSMVSTLQNSEEMSKHPHVTLFYTDTFKGRTAGFVNKILLEKFYGATVKVRKIYELDVNNRSLLNRALGKYLSDVSASLREGEPRTTCFAPIGGYKVMTSLGYLVGTLHNFPTAYIHEGSTVIHEIPTVNIEVDESFIRKHHRIFKKFFYGDCFEYDSLSKEEQKLINEQSMMFDQVEGLVELNPFGRFLCDQDKYYKYFKANVYLDRSIKDMIDRRYPSYWKDVYYEIKQLMYQHNNNQADYRSTLYHESDFSSLNEKKLDFHLFKGSNHPVFRAIWKYDEAKDCYLIAHIWFDHEDYERQAPRQIKEAQNKNNWVNITEQLYRS